jgi:SNF2 family DNA or RNA helicase
MNFEQFWQSGAASERQPDLMNIMIELRKCCIHPFIVAGAMVLILADVGLIGEEALHNKGTVLPCISGWANDPAQAPLVAATIASSGKIMLLDKQLAWLLAPGADHRILVFSQMTQCLDIQSDYLWHRGCAFECIDGAVKGSLRQQAFDCFCDMDGETRVFLMCMHAGDVGNNLTAAETVVIFDSDWNPQNDIQVQARCHHTSPTLYVQVYQMITHNKYERAMFDCEGRKFGLDRALLQSMPFASGMDDTPHDSDSMQLSGC